MEDAQGKVCGKGPGASLPSPGATAPAAPQTPSFGMLMAASLQRLHSFITDDSVTGHWLTFQSLPPAPEVGAETEGSNPLISWLAPPATSPSLGAVQVTSLT